MPPKAKFDLTTAITTCMKTKETVIEMLRKDADLLAKAIAEASKKRAIAAPVPSASTLDPKLAILLRKYGGAKPAAKPVPDLSAQIEEGTELLDWLDKIIEVAETGKLAYQPIPPTSERIRTIETLPEEIQALVRTEKDRGQQLTADTVLRRLEQGLENSAWMGKFWDARPAGILKFEEFLAWLVSHRNARIESTPTAPTNGNGDSKLIVEFAGKLGRPDLANRQALLKYIEQMSLLHESLKKVTGEDDVLEALKKALEMVEA